MLIGCIDYCGCKVGDSEAGRRPTYPCHCKGEQGEHAIGTHRHTPEIEQELSLLAGREIAVTFTPHLLPADRGILTTIYAPLLKKTSVSEILKKYNDVYKKEPFVRVLDYGLYPNIKHVRGTNFCDIGLKVNERTNTLIIVTAIDNLVKGASGQAVHNMNIMMGFDERRRLMHRLFCLKTEKVMDNTGKWAPFMLPNSSLCLNTSKGFFSIRSRNKNRAKRPRPYLFSGRSEHGGAFTTISVKAPCDADMKRIKSGKGGQLSSIAERQCVRERGGCKTPLLMTNLARGTQDNAFGCLCLLRWRYRHADAVDRIQAKIP
jgi:hypothetical protein